MIFHQIPSGGDRNFGYLAGCQETGKGVVIDPSPDPRPCAEKAAALDLDIVQVINTHSHFDHAGGNRFFKEHYRAAVVAHDWNASADRGVGDGQILTVGKLKLLFLHTPGHTDDCLCVRIDRELATGDTLFVGKVGGTTGEQDARKEFESLKKLMRLDDHIRVWPGHDYGIRPRSTIGEERKTNPFILRLHDFQEFLWLKDNWPAYKQEHNIP